MLINAVEARRLKSRKLFTLTSQGLNNMKKLFSSGLTFKHLDRQRGLMIFSVKEKFEAKPPIPNLPFDYTASKK